MDFRGQVWKRVWILEARSENGYGKWHVLVWNRVRIWRTGRHTPNMNSEEYPHPTNCKWNAASRYYVITYEYIIETIIHLLMFSRPGGREAYTGIWLEFSARWRGFWFYFTSRELPRVEQRFSQRIWKPSNGRSNLIENSWRRRSRRSKQSAHFGVLTKVCCVWCTCNECMHKMMCQRFKLWKNPIGLAWLIKSL